MGGKLTYFNPVSMKVDLRKGGICMQREQIVTAKYSISQTKTDARNNVKILTVVYHLVSKKRKV